MYRVMTHNCNAVHEGHYSVGLIIHEHYRLYRHKQVILTQWCLVLGAQSIGSNHDDSHL